MSYYVTSLISFSTVQKKTYTKYDGPMVSSSMPLLPLFTHLFLYILFYSGTVLNPAQISVRKYLMGLRILAALIIVSHAVFFGILIAAMACTPPLRNNYARHDTTTVVRVCAYTHTHTYTQSHTNARLHTYSHTFLRNYVAFERSSSGDGKPPEEYAFLVCATPSDMMVSHMPRLPNDKITAAMFAQDQRSRWERVKDERRRAKERWLNCAQNSRPFSSLTLHGLIVCRDLCRNSETI